MSSRVSDAGPLDLDDLGPKVGQKFGTVRPRNVMREVDNPDAFKGGLGQMCLLFGSRRVLSQARLYRCVTVGGRKF